MEPSPNNGATAGPMDGRRTRQRLAVLAVLGELDGFRTVREIHSALRERGEQVGLTTVYRVIHMLVAQDEVDVVHSSSGDTLYRRCGQDHHHHLMCRSCGQVLEVRGPDVEAWADRIADQHGFTDVGHSLEIIGTCEGCARQAAERPGTGDQ